MWKAIAEDGEILVKGPNVMQGYYRKPDETRGCSRMTAACARATSDGWMRTDTSIITDRKKELLKTAAGKFVAPAPIETCLKNLPVIANAIVVGDKA